MIRLDSGIVDGSVVSIHYDPMLAKVISYAPTRTQAALLLADALARTRLHGVRTNRDLLVNVLRHPAFLDGDTDTAFFDTHGLAALAAPLADDRDGRLSAVAAALADAAAQPRHRNGVRAACRAAGATCASGNQVKTYRDADGDRASRRVPVHPDGVRAARRRVVRLVSATPDQVVLADAAGAETAFEVAATATTVFVDSPAGRRRLHRGAPASSDPGPRSQKGSLLAPDARAGDPGRRRRSATPSPPGQPLSGWRR